MKHFQMLSLCLMLFVIARPAAAEPIPDPPPPSDNAAVWYLTAQLLMDNYDEDAKAVIDRWKDPDLEAAAKVINNKLFNEMSYIRRGAAAAHCSWAVDFKKDGLKALLPHLTVLRDYGKILAVSAQVQLEQGDPEGAIEDFVAIMRLSRHAADDGSLVGCLVQLSLDRVAAEAMAKQLHRFDRAQLERLSERLADLPERRTVQAAIAVERQGGLWIRSAVEQSLEEGKFEGLRELGLVGFGQEPETDQERAALIVNIDKQLDEFDDYYQRLYDTLGLPHGEFVKAEARLMNDIAKTKNTLVKLLMPALGPAYHAERRSKSLRAVLDAAIAMRLGGEEAFNQAVDPADGRPFDRKAIDDGLVISSRLKKQGKPVSLVFSDQLEEPLK